jgi:broad specificity phosphatase PhoE
VGLTSTIPAPPKGFTLDDEGEIPPPPKGFALDADQSSGPVTLNQRRPSWSGSLPAAPPPTPSLWKRAAGTVAGAVTGDLGYESGTPVAETPAVKTTTGLENVTTPGKRTLGALQLANVAAEGATPLVGPAALEAGAGIEAAPTVGKAVLAAAKSPMVRGLAEGAAAGKATELGTKALGASPEVQQEATSLAQIAPMVAHAAMSSPYEGLPPEGIPRAEALFRNLVYRAGQTLPEEPTLEQANAAYRAAMSNLHPDVNASHIEDARNLNDAWGVLKQSGRFSPTPPPAPPRQPGEPPLALPGQVPPMHSISAEEIQEIGDKIASLPHEERPQATLAAHTALSTEMLNQGKFMGPDGQLHQVANKGQADKLAQKFVNEEIGRRDAQAKQSAKEPVPAPPPGFTIEETPGEKKSEAPAFQKGDRVTLPKGDTGTVAHINSRLIRVKLDGGGMASVPAEQWGKVQKVESGDEREAAAAPQEVGNASPVSSGHGVSGSSPTSRPAGGSEAPVERTAQQRIPADESSTPAAREALRKLQAGEELTPDEKAIGERQKTRDAAIQSLGPEDAAKLSDKDFRRWMYPRSAEQINDPKTYEEIARALIARGDNPSEVRQSLEGRAGLLEGDPDVLLQKGHADTPEEAQAMAERNSGHNDRMRAAMDRVREIETKAKQDSSKGQIIFARHGETKLDQAGANETVAGWTQEPLDDRGVKAANKLADDIKAQKPTVIVTSDLARAKQTADIVGKKLGIPVQEDSRLRPQHVPETEGLKVGEAKPIWNSYEQNPDKKPKDGESWNEARTRQDAALKDVEAKVAAGERPVVITHSRNLEMELGERPKPGGFITRTGREKGGTTEPTKGVESGHGKTHLSANDRSDTGSAPAATPPRSGDSVGGAGGPIDHLGQGTGPRDEGRTGGAVSGVQSGALEEKPKYKFGSTQANIPASSDAAKALESARTRISNADLAGKGKEIGDGGNHVTVRYGIKGEDTEKIKSFLSAQSPFEASLGKTEKFPVSEHSEGSAPIIAPIEAPELHRLNAELEKHGDFAEPSFKAYKPHATVAYVDPAKADRYVGMNVTEGKKFTVSEIAISKKDGSQEVVKLEGKKAEAAPAKPKFSWQKHDIIPTKEGGIVAVPHAPEAADLTSHLADKITDGEMPKDNPGLKKIVDAFDGKPADPARMKQAQEALEVAIVQHAREIVAVGASTRQTFDELVKLYDSQPNLNVRTSTSIENQAYSTPAPLAYLADKLAGVNELTTLYEPTAGNGMLTIAANPKNVRVNELNPDRTAALRKQGFSETTSYDAAEKWDKAMEATLGKSYDAVVTNPPFGSVKDAQGNATKERVDGYKIGQIDHLIAARALEAMKDKGKATLILGASKFTAGGQSADDKIFFNWLYSHYNVAGHFELDGKLYGRQGAAWPVRVIAIDGREASSGIAPPVASIERVGSWKDVYDRFDQILASQSSRPARERGADSSLQRPATDEPGTLRTPAAPAVEKADREKPGTSEVGPHQQPGTPARPVSDRVAERSGGLAPADTSLRPDADVARSDRLEQGHKPESEPERTPDTGTDHRSPPAISPQSNDFQTSYAPASGKKDVGVLIPVNMKSPLEQAMSVLEDEVGDLDKFAAKELGYKSVNDLHDAFMGLQVDSVAAAIHEMQQGKAVVIADQTGIGKGRQAAAIIRWAAKRGDIPVFITKTPSLFTDMYGDLADIGTSDVNPFIVNSDEWITRPDGSRAFVNKPGLHRKAIENIRNTGTLPEGRNAVFLTYSQINVPNTQQQMLASLSSKAVFVLDESHNAGGDSNTGDFLRSVLQNAKGVTYLSATYAKRPDNMPLYFKTDMGEAIGDSGTLVQAMKDGGLPLQTVVSNNLVKAGQMFRRERSYDGVKMATKVDTDHRAEHTKIANGATEALRAIVDADKAFHTTYVAEAQKQAQKENKANQITGGGNQAGKAVHHTEFSSVVHNFVRQMLLGIKANTAADDAIASIRRGEKPIIAVDNTMGSFLSTYVGDNNLRDGDALENFDYRTVLSRALERSRYLQIKNAQGDVSKRFVPLSELDPETLRAYKDAQKTIDKLKIDLPVSPIDWIRQRIEAEGYSVAEITGRDLSVDYSTPEAPTVSRVPTQEQNDKVETTRRFNDGRLDSLIINVAGSTGISLHASEKFADQKPRHMIVAQAAQDINIFMQMLGRIHRTGQVKLPGYTILNADLPAEKRPSALLSKKMKSLNANTSSNTESATSVKAADMLNQYGDQIVGNYLADNPQLTAMLHVSPVNDDGSPTPDIARKATGRLAILPVKVQEEFYRDVEQQYNDYIAYLDSTNQNELEPKTFDYDARETRSDTLVEATNPNTPFGDSAIYGEYSIKSQGKPLTPDEATEAIKTHLDGKTPAAHANELIDKLEGELTYYKQSLDPESPMVGQAETVARTARAFIRDHQIGSTLRVEINGDVYSAAVANIRSTHKSSGNPFAMSKINVTLATNGSLRTLAVPATQLERIEVAKLYDKPEDIFRGRKAETRETAKIITGNLLAAYGELKDTRGTIINFSKADGTTEQGILLPKKFDFSKNTRGDYRLRDAAHALKFLRKSVNPRIEDMGIASRDGNVRVVNNAGKLEVVTPKAKARGGKYFLDHGITDLTGDFVSQQNTMRAAIPKGKETKVIEQLMKKSALYASPSMAEEAKGFGPKEPGEKSEPESLLAGESGELRPGELAKNVAEAAGTVGEYLRDVKRATGLARDLERGFETLATRKQSRRLAAVQTMRKLNIPRTDDVAVDAHLDDPENEPLTPVQDKVLDDVVLPILEHNDEMFGELNQGGVTIENYSHRMVKGKRGLVDRMAQGVKSSGTGGMLSKGAPQLKHRVMMALESPSGERKVVSIKNGQVTAWKNGEPENIGGISHTEEGRVFEDNDGQIWTVKQATKKEIEFHSNVSYYHSAIASALASSIQLGDALDNLHFLEAFKSSPEFHEIASKGSGNPPEGWKPTTMAQFKDYYFAPRTAEVLNKYDARMQSKGPNVMDEVGKFLRISMLLNPIRHPLNVAASWAFEKGVTGFLPHNWGVLWRTSNRATKAVLGQNQDLLDALDAGGALQSHRDAVKEIGDLFLHQVAEGLEKKEPWAVKLAEALGIEHGNLLNLIHEPSSKIAWTSSDIMMLQAAYEYQAKHPDVELKDALKEVGRIIPEYRVPTRIFDSTLIAKVMGEKWATIFGGYRYGLLKAFAETAKSALGAQEPAPGRTKAQEIAKGWDRIAMLGLGLLVMKYGLDELTKKLTKDEHATFWRVGPFGLMQAAIDVAEHKQSASQALTRVATPAPVLKSAAELATNREFFSGHQIYDPHADWWTEGRQLRKYLESQIGQIGQFEQAETSEQKRKFWWSQGGVTFAKTRAEKTAADIAASKVGTEAELPEDHENRVQRREILDQLRKGNAKPFEDAREKHQLTHRQILDIEHRARLQPLEDTVHGFSVAEVQRVLDAAKADKNQKEIDLLEKILRQKRARTHSWQSQSLVGAAQ